MVLFLPNSVELVVSIFGVLKANAVFVIANASMKADKLGYMLSNCGAKALVARSQQSQIAVDALAAAQSVVLTVWAGDGDVPVRTSSGATLAFDTVQAEFTPECPPRLAIDQDLACLIYTSGSTGDAKGVMSSHANVVFAASSIITYLENVADDIVLSALPLSFDYGLYQLLMVFKFGGTLVLERSFTYPAK